MSKFEHNGFTLIEVLVASIILFMAISIASYSYNHTINIGIKLDRLYRVAGRVDFLREKIKEEIRVNPQIESGEGYFENNRFRYAWNVRDKSEKNSQSGLDIESGMVDSGGYNIVLYSIVVEIYMTESGKLFREVEYGVLDWKRIK